MGNNTIIDNGQDIIDSRDIIQRIEELTEQFEGVDLAQIRKDWEADRLDDCDLEMLELWGLQDLAKEGSDYAPDWEYGEALIRDSYFVEYAQELAEDIGAINRDSNWPNYCIDWERAASDLKMDYSMIEFDGVDYWIRS